MGTTFTNLHIYRGIAEEARIFFPYAVIGNWSEHFVSVFSSEFLEETVAQKARQFSKKSKSTVLLTQLFDSDVLIFTVYKNGKKLTVHTAAPGKTGSPEDPSIFCEAFSLPFEDLARLRFLWEKGNAEEQLSLTALLLGAPLFADETTLPSEWKMRDSLAVDEWIADRPAPKKTQHTIQLQILQEISQFRYGPYTGSDVFLCSCDPYEDDPEQPYCYDQCQIWKRRPSGIYEPFWNTTCLIRLFSSSDRIIAIDDFAESNPILFDSANLISSGTCLGFDTIILPNGNLLWSCMVDSLSADRLLTTAEGTLLYRIDGSRGPVIQLISDKEIVFVYQDDPSHTMRVNTMTGEEIETIPSPFEPPLQETLFANGCYFATHKPLPGSNYEENMTDNGYTTNFQSCLLTKFDLELHPLLTATLPDSPQELFLSPDGKNLYVFFFRKGVLIFDTDTFTVISRLSDKNFLTPLQFDRNGHLWIARNDSFLESWDRNLQTALSRQKLEGTILGSFHNEQGKICITVYQQKTRTLKVYQIEE